MNQKPNLVRQMWTLFASQLVMAICMTTLGLTVLLILLHSSQETNQNLARLVPAMQSQIQKENDTVKLRKEASEFMDETISDAANRQSNLRSLIKIFAVFGAALIICSLSPGIFAYKLQCQTRAGDSAASPTG